MPYRFEFDPTNRILQGSFQGFVSEQELAIYYQAAIRHVARLSPRGYIVDVSAVTSSTVSPSVLRKFAQLPPVQPDPTRPGVIVASSAAAFGLMRLWESEAEATRPNVHVVHEHKEAWAILGIQKPRFEPLPDEVDKEAFDLNS